jgi:hypothetical protein
MLMIAQVILDKEVGASGILPRDERGIRAAVDGSALRAARILRIKSQSRCIKARHVSCRDAAFVEDNI